MLRIVLLLCALFALTVGVATANNGNSGNAQACHKGGWQTLTRFDGSAFSSEEDCVSYFTQVTSSNPRVVCSTLGGTFSLGPPDFWACASWGPVANADQLNLGLIALTPGCQAFGPVGTVVSGSLDSGSYPSRVTSICHYE
jgi:hypothetical protein